MSGAKDSDGPAMKVFRIDDGAQYWAAAASLREACRVYWETMDAVGDPEQGSLTFDECSERQARAVMINGDGDGTQEDAWTIAQREGPAIIGCSEWP